MSAGQVPRDYYDVLGVSRDAGDADIKKAFRRLARELHPDVNSHDPEAEEKFKEAAEAYEVLSDPERRATYDRYGHEGLRTGDYAPNFDTFGSVADIFEAFFGGGGFSSAFGGGGRAGGAIQGGDVAVGAEIELADAAHGSKVEVAYEVISLCENCRGNGAEPDRALQRHHDPSPRDRQRSKLHLQGAEGATDRDALPRQPSTERRRAGRLSESRRTVLRRQQSTVTVVRLSLGSETARPWSWMRDRTLSSIRSGGS